LYKAYLFIGPFLYINTEIKLTYLRSYLKDPVCNAYLFFKKYGLAWLKVSPQITIYDLEDIFLSVSSEGKQTTIA